MDDTTFQSVVASRIESAVDYTDSDLGERRQKAVRFALGDVSKELPSVPGRSRVVSRDLRDTINDVLPSLLRIFMGNRKAVEFCPMSQEDEAAAEQATDYANHIFWNDNDGFRILHSCIKDALLHGNGLGKAWWLKSDRMLAKRFSGIDDETFTAMLGELEGSEAELTEHSTEETPEGPKHNFVIQRLLTRGKVAIEALPGENFLIDREAKSITDTPFIGDWCDKRVGEAVALGFDYNEMLELAGSEDDSEDEEARNPNNVMAGADESADPAMRKIRWYEVYLKVDADGDGILEWRRVICAGSAHKVLEQEIVSDHPFFDFAMELIPHRWQAEGYIDCLDDLQLINTQLLRLGLEGLAQVITPRLVVSKNAGVDMKQLLDNKVGGVILANSTDAVFPLQTDKAAPQMALEAYRAMKEVRSERTGQSAASMGLTPDALQSVSRIAANEVVQKAQGRTEMIARVMAETGMKRLFKLILSLITCYQDKERVIRLRNKWVPMDPRNWSPDMDVTVNVGLGSGNVEEKTAFLQGFLTIQQQIMQAAGPQNPWVDVEGVRNALEDLCEASGKPSERYVITAEKWAEKQQQMAQQPPEPPKPDPAELLAQVENQKTQAKIQMDKEQQQFDMQMELLKDDRERDKAEGDLVLQAAKLGIDPGMALAFIRQHRVATPSQVPQ